MWTHFIWTFAYCKKNVQISVTPVSQLKFNFDIIFYVFSVEGFAQISSINNTSLILTFSFKPIWLNGKNLHYNFKLTHVFELSNLSHSPTGFSYLLYHHLQTSYLPYLNGRKTCKESTGKQNKRRIFATNTFLKYRPGEWLTETVPLCYCCFAPRIIYHILR